MDKPNKELLQAFIDWFMREYSNFGGKPIAERYDEEFDTFNNEFIDARYDAFQDGWKAQQAKVEELQTQLSLQRQRVKAFEEELTSSRNYGDELQKRVDFLEKHLKPCECGSKEISVDQEGYITKHCYRCGGIKTQEMIEQALKGEG